MLTTALKCGCGGNIEEGVGCVTYNGSDDHMQDAQHEDFMRAGGMGFGIYFDSFNAMMSMHLQANGLSFDKATTILRGE